MPRPYVSGVTFTGGQIVLTVQLEESLAGQPVEISGYATQNSGGFATFYETQTAGANPDGTVVVYVKGTPGKPFMIGEAVTVSLRAAKVWVTVLTPEGGISRGGTLMAAADGTTWNNVTQVGWAGDPPSPWSDGQAAADGDPKFPDS
jgi:hypothetical protein